MSFLGSLPEGFRSRIEVSYIAASWEELQVVSQTVDIILSSECIYREDLFTSHSDVIYSCLSREGVAIVAGKRYYFGCGGGTIAFSDFITTRFPQMQASLEETFENGMSNTREIIAVSFSRPMSS
jgi:hypothetical protein